VNRVVRFVTRKRSVTGFEADLSFVTDDDARRLMEDYHRQAVKAYHTGAYLGTLVACGGVLEGALTWSLMQQKDRAAQRFKEKYPKRAEAEQIEKWDLSRLIEVAVDLGILGQMATGASWAVKEFRNFIHPYLLLRAPEGERPKSARADDALALNALTAVKEICRSLKGRVAERECTVDPKAMNFAWLEERTVAGCRGPHSSNDVSALRSFGIRALVRLADTDEADVTPQQVADAGIEDCHEPIQDFEAPTQGQIDRVLAFVHGALGQGKPVAISCGAGYGRTGTLLACYLVKHGASADGAMGTVRTRAGRGPERDVQIAAIRAFEARAKKQSP